MVAGPASFRRDWERLWEVAERVADSPPAGIRFFTRGDARAALGFAGLRLESPYEAGRVSVYRNAPTNGIEFASTGGDGVHFCALYGEPDAAVTPIGVGRPAVR